MFHSVAITLAFLGAALSGVIAQGTLNCPVGTDLCGFHLSNGVFKYGRNDLVAAVIAAKQNPNIPDIVEGSLYHCENSTGAITWLTFCGNHLCVNSNPGTPQCTGPSDCCKVS